MERDDDRSRRFGQRHVALVDAAHSFVNDRHTHLRVRELLHLAAKRLDRALRVGLDDEGQILNGSLAGSRQNIVERAGAGPTAQDGGPSFDAAADGDFTRLFDTFHHPERIARTGHRVEAGDFDRRRRTGRFERTVVIVVDGPNATVGFAAQNRVPDVQSSILHDEPGDDAAALVAEGLEADADRRPFRIGLELPQFGSDLDGFQEFVDACPG